MNMPNCSGIELAQKILHIQTDAKIILYTGFEYVSQFNLLINSGISGIISKSASQQELLMAIRAAVNGYTFTSYFVITSTTYRRYNDSTT